MTAANIFTMHYKNGREAHNGDRVVLFSYDGKTIMASGILYDAAAGNDYCNGKIAATNPNDPCPNLKECLSLEDVLALLPDQQGVLAQTHPDLYKRIALVSDSSKKETA